MWTKLLYNKDNPAQYIMGYQEKDGKKYTTAGIALVASTGGFVLLFLCLLPDVIRQKCCKKKETKQETSNEENL
jgi:hypothetical protein